MKGYGNDSVSRDALKDTPPKTTSGRLERQRHLQQFFTSRPGEYPEPDSAYVHSAHLSAGSDRPDAVQSGDPGRPIGDPARHEGSGAERVQRTSK